MHTLQRDGDQSNDDSITVVLDTFAQKKLGDAFQVNASGVTVEGETGQLYNGHYEASHPELHLATLGGRLTQSLNPNLLQGHQTLSGTSVVVKLDWGFY